MYTFLMVLFVILSALLAIIILIQPGKGDMGLGSIGSGSQILFGGSGGRSFFEKVTWVMAALFIVGALGLSLIKSKERQQTSLVGFKSNAPVAPKQTPMPLDSVPSDSAPAESTDED